MTPTIQTNPLQKQAGIQFGARKQMPLRQLQPVSSDQVLFSGGTKTNTVRRFLATLGMAGAFSTLGMIAAPGMASADTGTTSSGNVCVSGSSINKASDLPDLQRSSQVFGHTQFVVDLCNSPLLSDSTKAEIDRMLANYMNSGDGQMAVVVIPETQQRELNSLATDIFNQVGIGNDSKDDGILMLVNAAAVKENRSTGRMQMVTGSGEVENILTSEKIVDLLVDNAIPALKKGDYDTAVSQTVKATTEYVHQELNRPPGEPGPDPAKVMLIIGIILGALVGGGLSIAGLLQLLKVKRRYDADIAVVRKPLQDMGSDYKVRYTNVHRLKTARALLSPSPREAQPNELLDATELVRGHLKEKEQPGYRPLLLEKGVSHAQPEVRAYAISTIAEEKLDRDVFDPFLDQLIVETDQEVFNALEAPLTQLATPDDVSKFEAGLNSDNAGMRQISVSILEKFYTPDQMKPFYDRLQIETDPEVIQNLQKAITEKAEARDVDLFQQGLESDKAELRRVAVTVLDKFYRPDSMQKFYSRLEKDKDSAVVEGLQSAIVNNAKATDVPLFVEGLENKRTELRRVAIQVLDKFYKPENMERFYNRLKIEKDGEVVSGLQKAILGNAAERDIPLFDKGLDEERKELRESSIRVQDKLFAKGTMEKFFTRLEKEQDDDLVNLLKDKVESNAAEEHSDFFLEQIKGNSANVKGSAIRGLGALKNDKYFGGLLDSFKADKVGGLDSEYEKAMASSVRESHLTQLYETLESNKREQQMGVSLLGTLSTDKAVDKLFDYLEAGKAEWKDDAANVLVDSVSEKNHGRLLEKLEVSSADSRGAAVRGIDKLGQVNDLPALFEALGKEKVSGVSDLLESASMNLGSNAAALPILGKALASSDSSRVQLVVTNALVQHGTNALDPLFDGLEKSSGWQGSVTSAVQGAIRQVGSGSESFDYMVEKAEGRNNAVREVAGGIAAERIRGWSSSDYDNDRTMGALKKLKQKNNEQVNNAADRVWEQLVSEKLSEVNRLGNFSNSSYSSHRSSLSSIASSSWDSRVSSAARSELSSLESAKRRYDEEERRRREEERRREEARRAEAARQSSMSSSSFSGGGFGGGSSGGNGGGI